MSGALLHRINQYANTNKKLCFIEVLFPTLAQNNKLTIANPSEFNTVEYRHDWMDMSNKGGVMKSNQFYHPVKNIRDQITLRKNMQRTDIL